MNIQSLVSVVIPTYNRREFLPRSINSVINQTYKNWELLIIDDGSTDGSEQLIEDYCKRNEKIKYASNQHNKGPSGARNYGVEIAKGDYIAFLDSDDEWVEVHIEETMNQFYKNNDVDWIFTGIKKLMGEEVMTESNYAAAFKEFGRYNKGKLTILDKKDLISNFLEYGGSILMQSSILKKSVFEKIKFDESMGAMEDVLFKFEAVANGLTLAYIDETHLKYFVHENNTINVNPKRKIEERFYSSEYLARLYETIPMKMELTKNQRDKINSKLADIYFWSLGYQYLKINDHAKANVWFLKGLKCRPFSFKFWKTYILSILKRLR